MALGKNIKGITIEIDGTTQKLDESLKKSATSAKSLTNELKAVNQGLKLDPKNVELAERKQKLLSEAVEATKQKLTDLKKAQEQAADAFAKGEISENEYRDLQTEIQKTENDLKSLSDELEQCGGKWDAYGAKMQDVGGKMQDIGGKIEGAGKAFAPVSAAAAAVGTASVAAAVDFEDAIAKLSTIADTTEETGVPLDELKSSIMELSNQTGISSSEIAENVYNAISAGQKTGDAVNFVGQATKLASAGFADSGAALDLLTTTLNAYGMESEEVTRVSDVLINTQNLGKTTVGELASAMGKVIPTANASNVSLENLATGYSIMTANGIATAESTTYMNSMLNELSKSGSKASDIIKEKTGKSFQELMADGSSLGEVLQILQDEASANGLAMNDMFGSAEAGKAALTLLSGGVEGYNQTLESMLECSGATDEAFEKLDTTSRKAKIAWNQIKNAGIELGSTILDMVSPAIEAVTNGIHVATEWFNNLGDGTKKIIAILIGLVAAIAPTLIVVGKLTTAAGGLVSGFGKILPVVGKIIPSFSSMGGVIGAITSPVGIAIAAIAALVAGFIYLYNTNEEFRDKVDACIADLKETFADMLETCKPLLEALGEAFQNLMTAIEPLIELWMEKVMAMADVIAEAAPYAIGYLTEIVNFITNVVSAITALLRGDLTGAFEYIKAAFGNIVNAMLNVWKMALTVLGGYLLMIWESIKQVFAPVGQWFADRFNEAKQAIITLFSNIGQWFADRWQDIKNALSTVKTWFETMFTNAVNAVKQAWAEIGQWFAARWQDIKNALSTVVSWFTTTFTNAVNAVKQAWAAIGQWFAARWQDIKNALSTVVSWFSSTFTNAVNAVHNAWSAIGSWFSARWSDIKEVFSNTSSFFSEKFNAAANAVRNAFNSIPQFFSNMWNQITNIFKNAGQSMGQAVSDSFKAAMNQVFSTIESIVNNFIGAINGCIGAINEIPGVSIGKLDKVSLPRLAKGGILSAGQAIVGEAGAELLTMAHGKAIVTPLSSSVKEDTLSQARGRGDFIQNNYITAPTPLTPYEVGRQTRNQTRNMVLQLRMAKG